MKQIEKFKTPQIKQELKELAPPKEKKYHVIPRRFYNLRKEHYTGLLREM